MAVLDEPRLVKILFTAEDVYSKIGSEYMIALDVALASGGSKDIVESSYSKMAVHKQRSHR